GAGPDPGADVDVARHQYNVRRDVGAATHHRVRHDAGAAGTQLLFRSERVFEGHLVVEAREAAVHGHVLASAEREQHRLLQPLVPDPAARARLRDARLATLQGHAAPHTTALPAVRHYTRLGSCTTPRRGAPNAPVR